MRSVSPTWRTSETWSWFAWSRWVICSRNFTCARRFRKRKYVSNESSISFNMDDVHPPECQACKHSHRKEHTHRNDLVSSSNAMSNSDHQRPNEQRDCSVAARLFDHVKPLRVNLLVWRCGNLKLRPAIKELGPTGLSSPGMSSQEPADFPCVLESEAHEPCGATSNNQEAPMDGLQ